jgi:hypothetical protein
MGRRILLASAVAALLLGGAPAIGHAQDATHFFATIEDLPLMPGLTEDVNAGVNFDSPAGRIAEAVAIGDVSERQVLDFYSAALPQLGWRRDGVAEFSREREILKMEFPALPQTGSPLTVRFALKPAGE